MKTRKAFLAKILAAAVAVTAVMPGALPVNAGKIVTTTDVPNVDVQSGWTASFEEKNVGGTQMWNFQSGANNRNDNNDFSSSEGPAVAYAENWDVTYNETTPTTVSVDLYPNGTVENMRFGILVKYIDPTHWAYINYDAQKTGNHWMLQNDGNTYPDIAGLENVSLANNAYTNVKIEYLSAGSIKVTVTPNGGAAVTATLDNEVLGTLETYAQENQKEIHFGFKGGTFQTQYTNINFKNVKKGTGETLTDVSFDDCGWTWVRENVDGQVMTDTDIVGGTNYHVLRAENAEVVASKEDLTDFANGTVSAVVYAREANAPFAIGARYSEMGSVQIGYDGNRWYQIVGTQKTELSGISLTPAAGTAYILSMTLADDVLSATVTPETEGAEATALVSDVNCAAVAAGSICLKAEANKELWVRDVRYTKVSKDDPTELQSAYDTITGEKGTANTDNKYYSDKWAPYQEALDEVKAFLDDAAAEKTPAEVTALKNSLTSKANGLVLVDKTALENRYNELKDREQGEYTDASWAAFTDALKAAKAVLDKAEAKESIASTEMSGAVTELNNAVRGLAEKTVSAEDKQELNTLYDSVKGKVNDNYTAESWKAYEDALKAVEAVVAKGDAATQKEAQTALEALKKAIAGLTSNVTAKFEKDAYTVDATASVETKLNTNAAAVTYKSSDPAVATVDAKGVVTGVKAGKAEITATVSGVTAKTTVTVTVPKITLTATNTKIQVKKSTKAIKVAEKIATDSVVMWESSNPKVATVTKAGKVKAKKIGKTTLTVTMKSGAKATCKLKVQKAKVVTKSIKVANTKVTLNVGDKYEIGAMRNPITATEKITYKASKAKVASVSKKGVVTAKAKGTCKVTVKCRGKKKVVTITVK